MIFLRGQGRAEEFSGIASRIGLLLHSPELEIQVSDLALVIVLGADARNFRLGLVKLRLAELDDGTEAQSISRLRQVESLGRFSQKLSSHLQTLVSRVGVEPGGANIANHAILQFSEVLFLGLRDRVRFRSSGRIEPPVENRNVNVKSCRGVAAIQRILAIRNQTRSSEYGNRGERKIALGSGETLCGLHVEILANQLRAALERLLKEGREIGRRGGGQHLVSQLKSALIGISQGV